MATKEELSKEYGCEVLWTGKKLILGLPISFTRYILTATRIITRSGILSIHEDEMELYRVYDKSLHLSLFGRILGYGTITLRSQYPDISVLSLRNIKNPREVRSIIDEAVQKERQKHMMKNRETIVDIEDMHAISSESE